MLKSRIQSSIWLLVVLFIYIYSDSYFALFLLLMSIAILIILVISTKLLIKNLEFKIEGPDTMPKNGSDTLYIEAINKGFLPISNLKCTLYLKNVLTGEEEEKTVYITLGSRSKERLYWDLKSEYCGKIEIKLLEVTCYDYLGIYANTIRPDISTDVLILPDTFNMNIDLLESQTENLESPVYSNDSKGMDNTEILGIKEYTPGDNIKNIHWKLTSKLDDLVIKELGSTVENSILVVLETSILENKKDAASVSDAMMEAFISTSKSLAEDTENHSIGWFDHDSGSLMMEEINSIDDLTSLIRGFLELEKKENAYSAMDYYFNRVAGDVFSHVIYVTSQNPRQYIQDLMDENGVTVLQCKPEDIDSGSMITDYGIVFTPENIQDKLYQLMV